MNNEFDFIFKLLRHKKIDIDEQEFSFQLKSHPDYPSLLSISDTLNFFGISNMAIRVMPDEIDDLPLNYISILSSDNLSFFSYIKNNKGNYYITIPNKNKLVKFSKSELLKNWNSFVLIIEENDKGIYELKKDAKTISFKQLNIVLMLLLVFLFYSSDFKYKEFIFVFLPLLGLSLSKLTIDALSGNITKSIFNKICDFSNNTDCNSVISSTEWKLLEKISFSDLSVIFFLNQLICFSIFSFINLYKDFFTIQVLLLIIAFPIIIGSLFYQKFVIKKWCPICLLIILILITELFYIYYANILDATLTSIKANSLFIFAIISSLSYSLWFIIKKLILKLKNSNEVEVNYNRLKRSYYVFKCILKIQPKVTNPYKDLINNNFSPKILFITNPYCTYCKKYFDVIRLINIKYGDQINLNIFLKSFYKKENDKSKLLFRNLMEIKTNNNIDYFLNSLGKWYDDKSIDNWLAIYGEKKINNKILDDYIITENTWCENNNINFTPCIVINNFQYPTEYYNVEDLVFLIEELIYDSKNN